MTLNKSRWPVFNVNPQAPVVQKIADEVVFRRFQGEGVEFFDAHLSENTDLGPSRFFIEFLYHDLF